MCHIFVEIDLMLLYLKYFVFFYVKTCVHDSDLPLQLMLKTKQHFNDLRLHVAYRDDMICFLEANVNNPDGGSIVTAEWLAFIHIRNVPRFNPDSFPNLSWEIMG
jgi:hypothetical protein